VLPAQQPDAAGDHRDPAGQVKLISHSSAHLARYLPMAMAAR
jgi:hypothetical protein